MATESFHPAAGQAVFGCPKGKCDAHSAVSWGAGYPALEAPRCEHGPMKRAEGDDHTVTVTEDELLEDEVRAELDREAAAVRRAARKAEIRERLLAAEA